MIKEFWVINAFFDIFPDAISAIIVGKVFIIHELTGATETALNGIENSFWLAAGELL